MDASVSEALQIVGWVLTVLGQEQVALKARQGFVTWMAATAYSLRFASSQACGGRSACTRPTWRCVRGRSGVGAETRPA